MSGLTLVISLALVTAQLPDLVLPDGNSAWLVRVVTSGGIAGIGAGDFAVSSEGRIVCSFQLRCPTNFNASDFHPLVEVIQMVTEPVPVVPVASLCRDCITRTITITRRDSTGILYVYTASWDDTTKDRLPAEVIRIYDAVRGLAK